MLTARLNGMTNLAWQKAFIAGGLCTLIVLAIHLYKKVTLDRLMLGVNLFLLVGALLFLGDISSLLYYYGTYKGAVFLSCVAIVGLFTTFFSETGFFVVKINDKKMIRTSSLRLLFVTLMSIIWSLITNKYGLIISAVIPFILLRTIYAKVGDKLRQAKED